MTDDEICPVCGLPKDLCVCGEISKGEQKIKVFVEKRKWGRLMTIVDGVDEKEVDLNSLATRLKTKCACGGTAKDGHIELQGDHRDKLKAILVQEGFPEENIDIVW